MIHEPSAHHRSTSAPLSAEPSPPLAPLRCSATRQDGRPCRAWALKGSSPPRCRVHARQTPARAALVPASPGRAEPSPSETRGCFYRQALTPSEVADLIPVAGDLSLQDEIALTRITLRRVVNLLEDRSLHPDQVANLSKLVLTGVRTVAHLLRQHQALTGSGADSYAVAMGVGLDALGSQLGIDL